MLKLEGVSFRYPGTFELREVNLEIARGAFVSLIGPNGSGKTTLLRLMAGGLEPQEGKVLLQEVEMRRLSPRERAHRLGVILSDQHFEFPFLVREVVAMGRYPHLRSWRGMTAGDWEIVRHSLRLTHTESLQERPISQLSSGERQRVLIARALAQQPRILLLDEPNAHLDVHHQIETFRLLHRLNQEQQMTVVVVLHDLTAAAAFSRQVLLLHQGQVVCQGTPWEVITEDNIRQTYGVEVRVRPSPSGGFPQVSYLPLEG